MALVLGTCYLTPARKSSTETSTFAARLSETATAVSRKGILATPTRSVYPSPPTSQADCALRVEGRLWPGHFPYSRPAHLTPPPPGLQ